MAEVAEGSEPQLDKQGVSQGRQDQGQTSDDKDEESADNKQEDVQAPPDSILTAADNSTVADNILTAADNSTAEDAVSTKSSDKDAASDEASKDGDQKSEPSQGKNEETPGAENSTLDAAKGGDPVVEDAAKGGDTAKGGDPKLESASKGHQTPDEAGGHQKMESGDLNLAAADASRKSDESVKVKAKPDAATAASGAKAKTAGTPAAESSLPCPAVASLGSEMSLCEVYHWMASGVTCTWASDVTCT